MLSSEMGMDEAVSSNKNDLTNVVAKGKRTKRRLRPLSPSTAAAVMTSSSSSASEGGAGSFQEEEEDMAKCLILLAQGRVGADDVLKTDKSTNTKLDFYLYECKTCNRTFPSFQALGGHRASHKKPKVEEKKSSSPSPPPPPPPSSLSFSLPPLFNFEEAKQSHMKIISPSVSLQLGCGNNNNNKVGLNLHSNKSKIHECSICGSEFTSGQALGGHMRRHRASTNNNNIAPTTITTTCDDAVDVKPPRNVLELDLNLPAPEDDIRDTKFQFPSNQNSMMLSAAPALVGCHY